MRAECESQVYRDLAGLFGPGGRGGDDRTLLDRFHVGADQAAFEELIRRHGPLVRGVCRRLLGDSHDADDAFQATFLVLVRQAGRLRDADRLGPWLYGVARRVAGQVRVRKARRREGPLVPGLVEGGVGPGPDLSDVPAILDAEIARIPSPFRAVLILCVLEGASAEEASIRLGCPVGTVKSRLARGRDALRDRLVRRGVAPGLVAAALATNHASPIAAALIRATLATIAAGPAAVAPGIAALARGALPAMTTKSIVTSALLLGGIVLAGAGTATWPRSPALAQQPAAEPRGVAPPAAADEARRSGPDAIARWKDSQYHLKLIVLACEAYAERNKHLPDPAIYGPDRKPMLSWRVALLPFLDEGALYREFHHYEPWDSPHNRTLIPRMPAIFRTPDSPVADGLTRFRGFEGKGTMFEGPGGFAYSDVTDGTVNTVLLVAAREPAVWTQPGELPYDATRPPPALDDADPTISLVGTVDGGMHYVAPRDENLLRMLVTRNGGEVVGDDLIRLDLAQPFGSIPARTAPNPAPQPPRGDLDPPARGDQGLERRVQQVEEKLDLILRKLDPSAAAGKP